MKQVKYLLLLIFGTTLTTNFSKKQRKIINLKRIENKTWLLFALCTSIVSTISAQERKSITVIGIGKLGLCVSLCLEQAGYRVLGIDINKTYVTNINNKTFYSFEPYVSKMLQKSTHFKASINLDDGLEFADIYYIMVDTPTTSDKTAYDHTKLNRVLSEINNKKVPNKHIIIGCTVFPGYIRTIGKNLIKDCTNTTLSYGPEFIAQGNIIYGLQHPDIVLIGEGSKKSGNITENIARSICLNSPKIFRMSPESAEIAKLALNCFITTKIAYANMIGDIADQTPGANKFDILNAVGGDKRVGHHCLKPGYGFGGPCFPRDNRALGNYAQMIEVEPFISQATDISNTWHTKFMSNQLLRLNREKYYFKNISYKENCAVPIIEESQKLVVAKILADHGKRVVIIDTQPVIKEVKKLYSNLFEYQIIK